MIKAFVIAGPTASGKSAFGVDIAKEINGEIISCDSMQIYKRMNIGTAKISIEEMDGVVHHLIDIVEPNEEFSVGEYSFRANELIGDIASRGKVPIVVGGTGLYIDSILYPMSFGGCKNIAIRKSLEEDCEKYGKEYMHALLREIDPLDAEKIHPNNVKRVLRALEIYKTTGERKSDMQISQRKLQYDCCMTVLDIARDVLYKRIDSRVDDMFERGLTKEVDALLEEGISFDGQSMQAIGYKEVVSGLNNGDLRSTMSDIIKKNTRHYAKRQITFFKKMPNLMWLDPKDATAEKVAEILNELN